MKYLVDKGVSKITDCTKGIPFRTICDFGKGESSLDSAIHRISNLFPTIEFKLAILFLRELGPRSYSFVHFHKNWIGLVIQKLHI